MMKKASIILSLIAIMGLTGCGGRNANPVMVAQYGDLQLSCAALAFELSNIDKDIQALLPDTNKTGQNIALGVAGTVFVLPLLCMDFKNAEKVEYDALRQRYNHLVSISMSKRCGLGAKKLPSIKEMQENHRKENKT